MDSRLTRSNAEKFKPGEKEGTSLSDEELMCRVAEDDMYAFDLLVKRFQCKIINFVYRMVGEREQAEDIAQETFLRVYRHRKRYRSVAAFSTWIYTIASNLAKSELRRRKIWQSITLGFTSKEKISLAEPSRPDDKLLNKELQEKIQGAIETLNLTYRTPFILRDIQGLSYEEISQILGCPLGTVKSRINRARAKLRRRLEGYSTEESSVP